MKTRSRKFVAATALALGLGIFSLPTFAKEDGSYTGTTVYTMDEPSRFTVSGRGKEYGARDGTVDRQAIFDRIDRYHSAY